MKCSTDNPKSFLVFTLNKTTQKKSLFLIVTASVKSSKRHLSITSEPAAQNKQGRSKLLPRGPQKITQNVKSISELHECF